jgi:3-oxoacyl-[acyl-carrier protein] reductase
MAKVFVSGASRGIGRSIALSFAKAGFEVGFSYNESKDLALSLADEIGSYTKAYSFCCDFSDRDSVRELSRAIGEKMGQVDVLINNVGVSSYGLFQDVSDEEFDRVFSVNFESMFFLTKDLVGQMISKHQGVVINISSVWGQTGASCEVLYSSTKAAVIGFTKALAKELAPSGIRVNCIAPGIVDTQMMSKFSDVEKSVMAEEIPVGRFAQSEEIASLAVYLAGSEASYITGQVCAVNGGLYC